MAEPGSIDVRASPTDREHAREVFARIEALHESKDPLRVREVFSEDVLVEDDGGTGTVRGWDQMELFLLGIWRAFPDFRVSVIDGPFVLGDRPGFAVRGLLTGTMDGPLNPPGFAATGKPISAEFGGFYELDGESVRVARIIMDTTKLARQLDALPPEGGIAERLAVRSQRLRVHWNRRRGPRP